jgi:hypothetical protein
VIVNVCTADGQAQGGTANSRGKHLRHANVQGWHALCDGRLRWKLPLGGYRNSDGVEDIPFRRTC